MGIKALGCDDAFDITIAIEDELALGQFQLEGLASVAGGGQGLIGLVQCPESRDECRFEIVRWFAGAEHGLGLLVAELLGRAHDGAHEGMAALGATGVEDHPNRQTGPVLALAQRAQVVRNRLRQHRDDTIWEVNRITALLGFTIKLAAGAHVMSDVGDGDRDDPAAGVGRIPVGLGMDGVVVVARVGRIDGDQRQRAQIGALAG